MPIITLYGAKGGTGRTTAAAAIARGMMKRGLHVMLIEAHIDDDPLARWCNAFDRSVLCAGGLDYRSAKTPGEIDMALRYAPPSDRHVTIIDTSPRVSATRTQAFELADLVLMPFTGFLDADIGIAKAATHLPGSADVQALPVRAPDGLSALVAEWMPVLQPSLPLDDRLVLFSDEERKLTKEMAAADCTKYDHEDTLANRLIHLGISACPFVPMAGLPPIKRKPPRALLDYNAGLRVGMSA